MVERSSAAIMGILYDRILSLGGPGMMSRLMISTVVSGVSIERKAGLLNLSQSRVTSSWSASYMVSLRCSNFF